MCFVGIAVLGGNVGGAGGAVGYGGWLGESGSVLEDSADSGYRGREQVWCLHVVPGKGSVVAVHLWPWGWPRECRNGQCWLARGQWHKEFGLSWVRVEGCEWGGYRKVWSHVVWKLT